jgi:hypothetical protein
LVRNLATSAASLDWLAAAGFSESWVEDLSEPEAESDGSLDPLARPVSAMPPVSVMAPGFWGSGRSGTLEASGNRLSSERAELLHRYQMRVELCPPPADALAQPEAVWFQDRSGPCQFQELELQKGSPSAAASRFAEEATNTLERADSRNPVAHISGKKDTRDMLVEGTTGRLAASTSVPSQASKLTPSPGS